MYIRSAFVGLFVLLGAMVVAPDFSTAQSSACNDDVAGKTEAQLQEDLARCNEEIKQWQGILNGTRERVSSIDGEVQALNAKIKAAETTIKSKNIAISQLSQDIDTRSEKIVDLEERIQEGRQSLAQLIRRTHEIDEYSLPEVVLASESISDFFLDLDAFNSVQLSLKEHFLSVRLQIAETAEERTLLGLVQDKERDAKYEVEQQKKKVSQTEAQQRELLAATKKEAKTYEQIVADRQAKASQINAALFRLRGVDGGGIPFGEALTYAREAQAQTGVRAAFILGILRQESNLGVNVGQCLLVDAATGDGKGKNTGTPFKALMKSDRDVQPFLALMDRLGRDPYNTPVSCSADTYYGGGMGPTQFIPSTWQIYGPRIEHALRVPVADPWNPEHAIMATAIYLQELGAAVGGYSAEQKAAAQYYAGGGWATRGLGYAASVLTHAEGYQADIEFLDGE